MPDALREELVRVVVGLGLHVLRKREGHRSGVRGTHQDAHRGERRGDQLLGTRDAVPVPRDRLKGVVHADVAARWHLELLQHRVRDTRREDIAGEEEHRQAVHGGEGRAGEHVRGARADR